MGWFEQVKNPKLKNSKKIEAGAPSGFWKKCSGCSEIIQHSKLEDSFQVCPYCNHHFRLTSLDRINLICDKESFDPFADNMVSNDPLNFSDKLSYKERLKKAYEKTGMKEGTLCGEAKIYGRPLAIGVMNFQFMGGSMGVATGEKIAQVFDKASEKKIPAVVICSSGGARMQEGILSLMQMGKTSAGLSRLKKNKIPFISVLTDPTTGGVAASFAMLGDVNLAEPKALIGFAGPRVIEQSIRETLPQGFQRSEFLLEHGFIDRVVHRHQLKNEISFFMKTFGQYCKKN